MELQRVVVRMLYDQKYTDLLSSNPDAFFGELDLGEREKAWLKEVDPRAFSVDVFRRDRGLKALLDEYPCTGALIFRTAGSLREMDAFFSSAHFHECIQKRESLAISFGAFLLQLVSGFGLNTLSMLKIESGLASFRRAHATSLNATDRAQHELYLSSRVALLEVSEGSLEAFHELRSRMSTRSSDLVEALVDEALDTQSLPNIARTSTEFLMLSSAVNADSDISIELLPEALYVVLKRAETGSSRAALLGELQVHGAEGDEALEILEDLFQDGIIVNGEIRAAT